jgi:hypothetical protein
MLNRTMAWAACTTRAMAGYPGHGGRITGDEHVRHRHLRRTRVG